MTDNEFIRMRQEEGSGRQTAGRGHRGFERLLERVRHLADRLAGRRTHDRERRT